MVREISPGIGGGKEEEPERPFAPIIPVEVPEIVSPPTPAIIPIIPRGETLPPYTYRPTPAPPSLPSPRIGYAPPPGERGETRPFQRLPFEAFAPLAPPPISVEEMPTASYIERERRIRALAGRILGNTLRSVFSGTPPPPRDILEASRIFAGEPTDTSRQWSFDWRGMLENYKRIFKKYYEGPTFDFAITGGTEDLYQPTDYTYAAGGYGEPGEITIRYGGGGTPSSQRNYSSNLINWRV